MWCGAFLPVGFLVGLVVGCRAGHCEGGMCACPPGARCEFECETPPCHVECAGADCLGACANGDCTCEEESSCSFTRERGPCHVLFQGDNERCDGQRENGSCTCGPDSTCSFECLDGNCSFICEPGARCVARCAVGSPGSQGCTFTVCAAGEVTLCDDGETMTCGAACPPPPETED